MRKAYRSWWAIGAGIALAACARWPMHPSATPAAAIVARPAAPVYPNVVLSNKLLYDMLIGEIAGEQGHTAVSTHYLGAAARVTQDPRVARRTAEVALYGSHYRQALAATQIWLKADPQNLEAHEAQAQAYLGLGQTAAAQVALGQVIQLAPPAETDNTYLAIAGLLARQPAGTHVDAVMRALVQERPQSAHAYFALSQLEAERGQDAAALQDIDHVLVLKPAWENAAVFKGHVLMLTGQAQEAAKFYRAFLHTYPEATELRLNYARYLVNVHDWTLALVEFRHVVVDLPDDAQVNYATGLLALQVGRYAEADQYLDRAVVLQPDNHEAEINLGEAAQAQNKNPKALYWYHRAAHGRARFAAELHIGMLFAHEKHWAEAAAKLTSLKPATHGERVEQALALDEVRFQQQHYHQALAGLDSALNAVPGSARLLYARALVELKLGMIPAHEKDLRTIITHNPQNAEALNALGYTLTNHSTQYAEARDLIGRALRLQPGDPYIMDSMGWAYYRLGRLKKATRYLRKALAVRPNAQISAHLGEVLWRRGLHQEAREVWMQALKKSPDSHALQRVTQKFMP